MEIKPPPWHPDPLLACNLAKMPCRPPQSAIATVPKLTAKAAKASEANRTLFIKIFLPIELNMDPRNATMYFLSYGPNLPETFPALRAAMPTEGTYDGKHYRLGALRKIGKLEAYQTDFRCQQPSRDNAIIQWRQAPTRKN